MQITPRAHDASGMELSFSEELMWQADVGDPQTLPFFDCARSLWLVLRLQGPLNQEALRRSLDSVIQRHEVLRSTFVARNGHPVRLISQTPPFSFATIDRRSLPPADPREIVEKEIRPLLEQFDLACGPLLRAALVALSSDEHILAIAVHHIVFDRWSRRLLELELRRFYCAFVTGSEPEVRPLRIQYQDYVLWQREQLESERGRKLISYWTHKLNGLPVLRLPCDGACGQAVSTRSGTSWFTIPQEDVSRLVALSRRARTTLAASMLAVFTVFLSRLCGTHDVAVGVPLSDRRRPEFEEIIGLFMNVVVVRAAIPNGATFLDLLDVVRRNLVDACIHQDLPYGYMQRLISTRPAYRVVFNFMPTLAGAEMDWAGIQAEPLPIPMELQSFADLSLHLRHEKEMLLCRLMYKADLFSQDCGQSFAAQIQTLTTAIAQAAHNPIDTY
ncbi:MAG TPA: condensation domain-containing protein [Candidatus Angelobacter sp.]|nr:condensation domain-containing protein [Candidatus Angelobacter sp.]